MRCCSTTVLHKLVVVVPLSKIEPSSFVVGKGKGSESQSGCIFAGLTVNYIFVLQFANGNMVFALYLFVLLFWFLLPRILADGWQHGLFQLHERGAEVLGIFGRH